MRKANEKVFAQLILSSFAGIRTSLSEIEAQVAADISKKRGISVEEFWKQSAETQFEQRKNSTAILPPERPRNSSSAF